MEAATHQFDVIGDIHGQFEALRALGRHLGYDVDRGWAHPDGRALVFLGDLVDRGPASLDVVNCVLDLVDAGRAVCLMGNHEFNLVGFSLGLEKPKASNKRTIEHVEAHRAAWKRALDRLADLPIAIELPGLRLVHAVWHRAAFDRVRGALAPRQRGAHTATTTASWLGEHVVLESPFSDGGLRAGLTAERFADQHDTAHEILLKGYEVAAATPFRDVDDKDRDRERVAWWYRADPPVPTDRTTVIGHYWNLPPLPGRHDALVPPHPSGTAALREWQQAHAKFVPPSGFADVPASAKFVCVDYNGVSVGGGGPCLGAYRWPQRQVAWVRLPESG